MGATLNGVCGYWPPVKPGFRRRDLSSPLRHYHVSVLVWFDSSVVVVLSLLFLNTKAKVYKSPCWLGVLGRGHRAVSAWQALRAPLQNQVHGSTKAVRHRADGAEGLPAQGRRAPVPVCGASGAGENMATGRATSAGSRPEKRPHPEMAPSAQQMSGVWSTAGLGSWVPALGPTCHPPTPGPRAAPGPGTSSPRPRATQPLPPAYVPKMYSCGRST